MSPGVLGAGGWPSSFSAGVMLRLIDQHGEQQSRTSVTWLLGSKFSLGPHPDLEQTPALHRWAGRELSPGAALATARLLTPAALGSGMLLSGSLEVLCSGPASRLLAQSQIFWAPFSAAAPLGGHREISSAGLLRWEGLLQSHVYQYIQRDEASLLPTEDSDEAVPFFLRGHTDLGVEGGRERKGFSSAGTSGDL